MKIGKDVIKKYLHENKVQLTSALIFVLVFAPFVLDMDYSEANLAGSLGQDHPLTVLVLTAAIFGLLVSSGCTLAAEIVWTYLDRKKTRRMVFVDYEVDISKVGKGFFDHRMKQAFDIIDEYVKLERIEGPPGWR